MLGFCLLNVLNMSHTKYAQTCEFMYKYYNNLLPAFFSSCFHPTLNTICTIETIVTIGLSGLGHYSRTLLLAIIAPDHDPHRILPPDITSAINPRNDIVQGVSEHFSSLLSYTVHRL